MNYSMKMLETHRCQMKALLNDTSREQACFLLCGIAHGHDETIVLVKEVIALESKDLTVHSYDRLQVSPGAMLSIARQAQKIKASICMVHTHPMSNGEVEFSQADDLGNLKTFEFFGRMIPELPHTCLVWDGKMKVVEGRIYFSPDDWKSIDQIQVVSGENREVFGSRLKKSFNISETYDRQALLLGNEGQEILSKLKVGVIGCGGVGSVASTILAHSGISQFKLFDFDLTSKSNIPRIIGARFADIGTLKVNLLKRYIQDLNPDAKVELFDSPVENADLLKELVGLDILVCGTDDTTSRAYLNQVSHQYYIPILDMGVQFNVDSNGKLVSETGRANLMLPGTACMCCCGYINPVTLAKEGLSPDQHEQQVRDGYLAGSDINEPSMMVFNIQVASVGSQRLIEWVTGLNRVNQNQYDSFRFLGINSEQGRRKVNKRSAGNCLFCSQTSMYLGAGDSQKQLIKPRPFISR